VNTHRPHLEAALPGSHSDLLRAAHCTAALYEAWNATEPSAERAALALIWRNKVQPVQATHD